MKKIILIIVLVAITATSVFAVEETDKAYNAKIEKICGSVYKVAYDTAQGRVGGRNYIEAYKMCGEIGANVIEDIDPSQEAIDASVQMCKGIADEVYKAPSYYLLNPEDFANGMMHACIERFRE